MSGGGFESFLAHPEQDEQECFFDLAIDLLCVAGLDGYFKQLNPAWSRTLGWSNAELTNKPWLHFVHPDDRETTINAKERLSAGDSVIGFENRYRCKDGSYRWLSWSSFPVKEDLVFAVARDVTETRSADRERQSHFFFLESLERVNRTIQRAESVEEMLREVIKTVREIFDADRCWLLFPCDPETDCFRILFEDTKPDHPGMLASQRELPVTDEIASVLRASLVNDEPIASDFVADHNRPDFARKHNVRSQLAKAIHPKVGVPWMVGLHQCTSNRVWTPDELQLFKEISRRIEDGLSSMLFLRDLHQSEERFRTVVEQAGDAFFLLTMSGRILDVNARACEVLGYTREEFLSMSVSDIDIEVDSQHHKERFWDSLETRTVTTLEGVHRRKDGTTFPVEVRLSCLRLGEEQLMLGLARDVTQRKQTEHAIEEEKEKYRTLVDQLPFGIVIHRYDGMVLYANPATYEMLGYTSDSGLVGKPIAQFVHPNSLVQVGGRMKTLIETGEPVPYVEEQLLHRDSSIVDCRIAGSLIQFGGTPAVQVIVGDVTERKREQRELVRLSTAVRMSADAVISTDLEGRILENNDAALLMTGKEALVDASIFQLFASPDVIRGAIREAADKGFIRQREYTAVNASQEELPVEMSISRVDDTSGAPAGLTAIVQDVSDRKRAEEELAKHRQHLEDLVRQRTAQLQAANKELEAFSYSVSHDLRAPLRSIDGFGHVLVEDYADQLDDEARDCLNRIQNASQRMGGLIDDLLRLSRITRAEMQLERVDLSALASLICETMRETEPDRLVEFQIEEDLQAKGDPALICVALENLLGNAWKFTSKRDKAVIEFGAETTDKGLRFHVRDNGAGFEMTYVERLFGAFQRLHTEEFPGSGIGLATVQRIIHRHGGRVWAEGKENEGATFYFTLPSVEDHA